MMTRTPSRSIRGRVKRSMRCEVVVPMHTGAMPTGFASSFGTLRTFGAVWMTAWPFRSKRVVRPRSNMWICVASRMPNSVRSRVTVSPARSSRTWRSSMGMVRTWCAMALEPVLDAVGGDHRRGAPRRVALDVHGDGVHGDVRRGGLDVDRERGAASAQALRADAQRVHGDRQHLLELLAFRILAGRPERARRRHLGEVHAYIRGAADADADDGGRAHAAAELDDLVDDEGLDAVDALSRDEHLQERAVLAA